MKPLRILLFSIALLVLGVWFFSRPVEEFFKSQLETSLPSLPRSSTHQHPSPEVSPTAASPTPSPSRLPEGSTLRPPPQDSDGSPKQSTTNDPLPPPQQEPTSPPQNAAPLPGNENNSVAASTSKPLSKVPQGKWATTIPSIQEYLVAVSPKNLDTLVDFQKNYANVDMTDTHVFAKTVLVERAKYGYELTDQTAAAYNSWLKNVERLQSELVIARGKLLGIAISGIDENGRGFTLIGFDGISPRYIYTQNVQAAISTSANLVRLNATVDPLVGNIVSGNGLYININDHGTVYEHAEFQLPNNGGSRIILKEIDDTGNRAHMTHVVGTVAAWGYTENLLGMAPRTWIRSFIQQANSDVTGYGMRYPGELSEVTNNATSSLTMRSVIGTTSLGSTDNSTSRGIYTYTTSSFDQVLWDSPYYLHFYAAGNDGDTGVFFATLAADHNISKNVITIGSVKDVTRDTNGTYISGGAISSFSSRGPTFDGRIKPDLTANGDNLTSTSSTNSTAVMSGTSMATPNASGSTLLLADYYSQCFPGHFLRSSTLKALLINSAEDRGTLGPDYTYGWGILNVKKATEIVKRYADTPKSRVVIEDVLTSNQTWTANYTYDGAGAIRTTLAWLDPAGPSLSDTATTDHTTRIVNNLNLVVIGPDGNHLPYVMPFVTGNSTYSAYDTNLYGANATTGNNTTDNVEQVYIASPVAGNYTLQVTGGTLSGGSQKFSIAVTGMAQTVPIAPAISSISPILGDGSDNFSLTVNGSDFLLGSDVILRRNGFPDVEAFGEQITSGQIICRLNTSTISSGRWDVVVNAPDGSEAVLPAAFFLQGWKTLYSNDFTSSAGFVFSGGAWAIGVPTYASGGPSTAFSDTKILAYNLSGNYENSMASTYYAKTPPIDCRNGTNTHLTFRRWLGVESSSYDHATIQISTNNSTWTDVWTNPTGNLQDAGWTVQSYDISAIADGKQTVYIRWGMGISDSSVSFCGWNIDDLQILSAVQPPAFTSTPPTTASIGQLFSYAINTSDFDTPATSLALTVSGLPSWMTFTDTGNGTGTLTGTPLATGSANVIVTLSDGYYTTRQVVSFFIQPIGGNHSPTIEATTFPNSNIGIPFTTTIHATDADGNTLSLTTSARPAWLTFTDHGDGSGTFSGTPIPGTDGTFNITVTASDGLANTQQAFVLKVINLNDPVVSVEATDSAASEASADIGYFTLTRVGGNVSSSVTVQYSLDGSATEGTDYTSLSGVATFSSGNTTTSITVTPIDDAEYEGNETVVLTLVDGSGYFVGSPTSASLTIADNDKPTVSIASLIATPTEGTSGNFSFTRTGITSLGALTVNYTVSGTANPGADYPLLAGNITIPSGQSSVNLEVPAWQDDLVEPAETVLLTITANSSYAIAASQGNATMSIIDDTEQPMLTITASDNEASELFSYKGNGTFTITRAGSTALALTVNLLANGTATAGSDYVPLPSSVTIPVGQSTITLPLVALNDSEIEPDETVTLNLQAGTGFTIGTSSSATVNLYDDETTQVRVEIGDSKMIEASTADPGTFTLRRLGSRVAAITVNYSLSGTAINGADYSTLNGTATIGANLGSATITVTPINDALVEGSETVILTVGTGTGYTVIEPSSASLEIREDETVDVSLTVQDATCKEQPTPDTGSFRITRSATSAAPLTVNYTLNGTANNGTDYSTLNGTATIPANATTVDVIATPIHDALVEGYESIIMTIASNGANYDIGDNRMQTLWIQDDESPSISIVASDNAAAEADGGAANSGLYTITATFAPATDLTISYTVGGTATNGVDYSLLSGTLVIPAGQTSATIPVEVVDDNIGEASETVTVTLGQVAGYNVLITTAVTVTIAANDLPEANIVVADASASENPVDTTRFVVTLSKTPSANTTTIGYNLSGTATSGSDYTAPGIFTIPKGSNTGNITITPLNDSIAEGSETVIITLAPSPNYTIGANVTASATITDDESDGTKTLIVNSSALNVPESSNATFTVSLGEAIVSDTFVSVTFQSGDTDLSVQSGGNLTFTPANWNTPQLVTLATAKDADAVNGTAFFLVASPQRPSKIVTATELDTEGPPSITITSPSISLIALPDRTNSLLLTASAISAVGIPSTAWSQVSGPSTTVFADSSSASTSALFPVIGTYVLRITATANSQNASADLTVIVGGTGVAYTGTDIGAIALGGSASTNGTSFTLTGEGPDITGTTDKCYFLGSPMSGNFSVSARVLSQTNTGAWAKAGLMIRQNTQTNAINAATLMTPSNGVRFEYRNGATNNTSDNGTTGVATPYWVKITKNGTTISGWSSANGTTWTQVGANQTLSMTDPVLVGLVVSSYSAGNYSTAVFDNLSGFSASNAAPQCNIGTAPTATIGSSVLLSGTASDDGLPGDSSLTVTWTKLSGNGSVTFGSPNAASSTVTFSETGNYVLRLSANDGATTVFQDLPISVTGSGYDTWISSYPGATSLPGVNEDPDRDGLSNLLEYALGGNPSLKDASTLLSTATTGAGASTYLALTFRRAQADITYTVQGSSDLINWSDIPFTLVAVGDSQSVSDTVAINASTSKRFMRLKVIKN